MLWIGLAAVVLGLVWFVSTRPRRAVADRELGKGQGNAAGTRYKNRSSRRRKDKGDAGDGSR